MANISNLYDFIEKAVKSRKYPENTAQGLKAALKLFEKELNDEEKQSIDSLKSNLDQIYNQVFNKNKQFSAASLATYKSRVLKVITDYEEHGTDATKMANWAPKKVNRAPRKKEVADNGTSLERMSASAPASSHKIELVLRPDTKCILILPMDLNETDVKKIKGVLDSMAIAS